MNTPHTFTGALPAPTPTRIMATHPVLAISLLAGVAFAVVMLVVANQLLGDEAQRKLLAEEAAEESPSSTPPTSSAAEEVHPPHPPFRDCEGGSSGADGCIRHQPAAVDMMVSSPPPPITIPISTPDGVGVTAIPHDSVPIAADANGSGERGFISTADLTPPVQGSPPVSVDGGRSLSSSVDVLSTHGRTASDTDSIFSLGE